MGKLSPIPLRLTLLLACSILALSSSITMSTAAVQEGGDLGRKVGGRSKIPDVKHNKEIQDLGRYSVGEFNKDMMKYQKGSQSDGPVKFKEVVEAEQQVVAGIKYYLTISATTASGEPKIFDAEVVVRPWEKKQELLTFSPSPPTK